jgi:hypothetical protein
MSERSRTRRTSIMSSSSVQPPPASTISSIKDKGGRTNAQTPIQKYNIVLDHRRDELEQHRLIKTQYFRFVNFHHLDNSVLVGTATNAEIKDDRTKNDDTQSEYYTCTVRPDSRLRRTVSAAVLNL